MIVARGVRCAVTVAVGPVVDLRMVGLAVGLFVVWAPAVLEAMQLVCL